MKEYHIAPFILAYYASTFTGSGSKDYAKLITPSVVERVPEWSMYTAALVPFAYLIGASSSLSIEHVGTIMSYICLLYSVMGLVRDSKTKMNRYTMPLFWSGALVVMYNTPLVRENINTMYLLALLYSLTLIKNNVATGADSLQDIALVHLLFYFTK